jgi:hypothetical protein
LSDDDDDVRSVDAGNDIVTQDADADVADVLLPDDTHGMRRKLSGEMSRHRQRTRRWLSSANDGQLHIRMRLQTRLGP